MLRSNGYHIYQSSGFGQGWGSDHEQRIYGTCELYSVNHPKDIPKEKIESLAATNLNEFYIEKILNIRAQGRIQRSLSLKCVGSDTSVKTILCWSAVLCG